MAIRGKPTTIRLIASPPSQTGRPIQPEYPDLFRRSFSLDKNTTKISALRAEPGGTRSLQERPAGGVPACFEERG